MARRSREHEITRTRGAKPGRDRHVVLWNVRNRDDPAVEKCLANQSGDRTLLGTTELHTVGAGTHEAIGCPGVDSSDLGAEKPHERAHHVVGELHAALFTRRSDRDLVLAFAHPRVALLVAEVARRDHAGGDDQDQ